MHEGYNLKDSGSQLYLKEPGEDVKFKDRDVVVTGEVHCRLESHCLHALLKAVNSPKVFLKDAPLNNASARQQVL